MAKRNKRNKNVGGGAEDTSSVAKGGNPDAAANTNLADFAKGQAAKEAKSKAAKVPKVATDGRPKLPSLPRKTAAPKPFKDCECGCGLKTRSKFAPGHDSRLRGWALRVARGICDTAYIKEYAGEGEAVAVDAYIKGLKKEGKFEALKTAQPMKKAEKKAAVE